MGRSPPTLRLHQKKKRRFDLVSKGERDGGDLERKTKKLTEEWDNHGPSGSSNNCFKKEKERIGKEGGNRRREGREGGKREDKVLGKPHRRRLPTAIISSRGKRNAGTNCNLPGN